MAAEPHSLMDLARSICPNVRDTNEGSGTSSRNLTTQLHPALSSTVPAPHAMDVATTTASSTRASMLSYDAVPRMPSNPRSHDSQFIAEEAEFRQWLAGNQLTTQTIDTLFENGFRNRCLFETLLESDAREIGITPLAQVRNTQRLFRHTAVPSSNTTPSSGCTDTPQHGPQQVPHP